MRLQEREEEQVKRHKEILVDYPMMTLLQVMSEGFIVKAPMLVAFQSQQLFHGLTEPNVKIMYTEKWTSAMVSSDYGSRGLLQSLQ